MIKSRNQSSGTYHQDPADGIAQRIQSSYFSLFQALYTKMAELSHGA